MLRVHHVSIRQMFCSILRPNNNGQEYCLSGSARYINPVICDRGLMLWFYSTGVWTHDCPVQAGITYWCNNVYVYVNQHMGNTATSAVEVALWVLCPHQFNVCLVHNRFSCQQVCGSSIEGVSNNQLRLAIYRSTICVSVLPPVVTALQQESG